MKVEKRRSTISIQQLKKYIFIGLTPTIQFSKTELTARRWVDLKKYRYKGRIFQLRPPPPAPQCWFRHLTMIPIVYRSHIIDIRTSIEIAVCIIFFFIWDNKKQDHWFFFTFFRICFFSFTFFTISLFFPTQIRFFSFKTYLYQEVSVSLFIFGSFVFCRLSSCSTFFSVLKEIKKKEWRKKNKKQRGRGKSSSSKQEQK